MNITYREMTRADVAAVLDMMRTFYTSPAVASDGSEEIYRADIEACLDPNTPLSGYVFEQGGALAGYAMTAHSFSTEYGRPCIWIEDLYLENELRGTGVATRFFDYLKTQYPDAVHRLEVEKENKRAIKAYVKNDFQEIPYYEMIRFMDSGKR